MHRLVPHGLLPEHAHSFPDTTDPLYGKRPPIEWKKYQTRQATERQLETWFSEGYSAYGIVYGGLSNLIVIDFDDVEIQAEFIQEYPHLLETYVVQSGLRKIYLEADFPVGTTKLRGGDLKAEGSYVVGASSQIAGGEWQVVNDAPLYSISAVELNQFLLEFGLQQHISSQLSNLANDMKSPDDFISVGRPSVRKALNFAISPSHAVADISKMDMPTKTCVFVQTTTGDKLSEDLHSGTPFPESLISVSC